MHVSEQQQLTLLAEGKILVKFTEASSRSHYYIKNTIFDSSECSPVIVQLYTVDLWERMNVLEPHPDFDEWVHVSGPGCFRYQSYMPRAAYRISKLGKIILAAESD